MRTLIFVLSAILALTSGAATAAPAASSASADRPDVELPLEGTVITNPDWREKPTPEEMGNYFPQVALLLGLSGRSVMVCSVSALGVVENCKITAESPVGMGFGDAALALAKYFQMNPMMVNGAPVGGGQVRVPIQFLDPWDQVQSGDNAGPAPTTASPRALELARRLAGLNYGPERMQAASEQMHAYLEQRFGSTSLTEQEQVAIDDYVAATGTTNAIQVEAVAQSYARQFSDQELADADAFFESPSGRAWLARSNHAGDDLRSVAQRIAAAARQDARTRFCAKFDCPTLSVGVPPPAAPAARKP